MKKLIYFIPLFLILTACQADKTENLLPNEEAASKILLTYLLGDSQASKLVPLFNSCKLEYRQGKPKKTDAHAIGAYTCNIDSGENQEEILVISQAPELKNEVNPSKKNRPNLVYIARLKHDKTDNHISGTKLLFDVNKNTVLERVRVYETK